jgi:hypothetical protein
MGRYIADVRFLASIYPGKITPIRRNYGTSLHGEGKGANRSTLFELEPVARGKKPFVLPIYDSFEEILDIVALSSMANSPRKPRGSKPVSSDSIVADLLKEWTGGLFNVPQDASPGIMEIRPMKVEMEKFYRDARELPGPNVGEIKYMTDRQTQYFEFLFTEGERHHKQNNWKEITETMRIAAEWLGHDREWSSRAIAKESGPCPLCTQIVANAAIFCPSCHQQIRAMPPEILALQAKQGPQQASK